jgi:ATP-binding cassette subfamily B protein
MIGLINGAVTLVGSLVLMAVLDLPLTVITVVAILIVAVVVTALMPAISAAHERAQSALGSLGGDLEGSLRAIRTVKASNAKDRQLGSLLQHAADARVHGVKAVRREALIWTIAWVGTQAAIIAILGFGAWRVSIAAMTVSTLIAFLLYAFGILDPVMMLSQNLATLQLGLAAAARIAEVETMDIESTHTGPSSTSRPGERGPDRQPPAIELRGVTARYDGSPTPAVIDLSIKVPHRGHVAIVGPSGAGKTTVLSLVLRFLEPEHGMLLLDGRPYTYSATRRCAPGWRTSNRRRPSSPAHFGRTSSSPIRKPASPTLTLCSSNSGWRIRSHRCRTAWTQRSATHRARPRPARKGFDPATGRGHRPGQRAHRSCHPGDDPRLRQTFRGRHDRPPAVRDRGR